MEKKYILDNTDTITLEGANLKRIIALRNFGDVRAGQKGGYVESEDNLSQNGDCWIYDDAKVYNHATIRGHAKVFNSAVVKGDACVYEYARVYNCSSIVDHAIVGGEARITGNAKVCGHASVSHMAQITDRAEITQYAEVGGEVWMQGCAIIKGYAKVGGKTVIKGNAVVENIGDYITFKNWWSSGRFFTWTKSNNKWAVGCFYGTGKELIEKAYKDSEKSGREYERVVKYVESI